MSPLNSWNGYRPHARPPPASKILSNSSLSAKPSIKSGSSSSKGLVSCRPNKVLGYDQVINVNFAWGSVLGAKGSIHTVLCGGAMKLTINPFAPKTEPQTNWKVCMIRNEPMRRSKRGVTSPGFRPCMVPPEHEASLDHCQLQSPRADPSLSCLANLSCTRLKCDP